MTKAMYRNSKCAVIDGIETSQWFDVKSGVKQAGADPEISERGGRKPNSRKGGPEYRLFSAAFSHFLINLLQIFQQKGGPRPVRPLP